MANNLTVYSENKLLDHINGTAAFTMPTQVYVGLSSTTINNDGTGATEPNVSWYARQTIDFDAAVAGAADNDAEVNFGTCDETISITYLALYDAVTAGNMLWYGPLTTTRNLVADDVVKIPLGDVDLSIS